MAPGSPFSGRSAGSFPEQRLVKDGVPSKIYSWEQNSREAKTRVQEARRPVTLLDTKKRITNQNCSYNFWLKFLSHFKKLKHARGSRAGPSPFFTMFLPIWRAPSLAVTKLSCINTKFTSTRREREENSILHTFARSPENWRPVENIIFSETLLVRVRNETY